MSELIRARAARGAAPASVCAAVALLASAANPALAEVIVTAGPTEIRHRDRLRTVLINGATGALLVVHVDRRDDGQRRAVALLGYGQDHLEHTQHLLRLALLSRRSLKKLPGIL